MAQVAAVSIFAARVLRSNPLPSIVASSVVFCRFIAACVSSSYTKYYCYTNWRSVYFFNPQLPSDSYFAQHWQGGYFDQTSLYLLGLVCNLGHDGEMCPREPSPCNLTIIDINGCHKVRVAFCTCDTGTPLEERYWQLLRMRWYPASFTRTRTAFSFDLLETYHKITLQGKLNLYDFYLAIMQKSDNQGRSEPMVSDPP